MGEPHFSIVSTDYESVEHAVFDQHLRAFMTSAHDTLPLPPEGVFERLPFLHYSAPSFIQIRSVRNYKIKLPTDGVHPGVLRLWRLVLPRLRNDLWSWRIVEEVFGPQQLDSMDERGVMINEINHMLQNMPGVQELRAQWISELRVLARTTDEAVAQDDKKEYRAEAVRMIRGYLVRLAQAVRLQRDFAAILFVPRVHAHVSSDVDVIPEDLPVEEDDASGDQATLEDVTNVRDPGFQATGGNGYHDFSNGYHGSARNGGKNGPTEALYHYASLQMPVGIYGGFPALHPVVGRKRGTPFVPNMAMLPQSRVEPASGVADQQMAHIRLTPRHSSLSPLFGVARNYHDEVVPLLHDDYQLFPLGLDPPSSSSIPPDFVDCTGLEELGADEAVYPRPKRRKVAEGDAERVGNRSPMLTLQSPPWNGL